MFGINILLPEKFISFPGSEQQVSYLLLGLFVEHPNSESLTRTYARA